MYYASWTNVQDIPAGLVPSVSGLRSLFTNGVYIGHWVHKEAITRWNHHEPIIPLDLFMYAFNRLSPTDFLGEPNPNYAPYRTWIRHNKEERGVEPPTYSGLVFSDDIPGSRTSFVSVWGTSDKIYKYQLYHKYRSNVWHIQAGIVDPIVDGLLLERLEATTIDEDAWQQALDSMKYGERAENRRVESSIREAQRAQENLIASLTTLNNPEMIRRAEARFEALEREIKMLSAELERLKSDQGHHLALIRARPALEKLIARWKDVPRQERRSLFEACARFIKITRLNEGCA